MSPGAWDAIGSGALLVPRERHALGIFHGAGAAAVINGLVTNDVAALAPGESCYAAALTPKGKVIADLRVLRQADAVMVDVAPAAAAGWWDMIRKFVNPRLARFEDVSASQHVIDIAGPRAGHVVTALLPDHAAGRSVGAHVTAPFAGGTITALHVRLGDTDLWSLYLPANLAAEVTAACVSAGAVIGEGTLLEVLRIEAGRPLWGVDMDDATLTQEARLDEREAVSYTKGCYTGQETVARLHFRGHVNRLLRGVKIPSGNAPPRGATLVGEDGSAVGDVRSTAHSPRLGAIGLAMVRREVEPGRRLVARWEDGSQDVEVEVTDLPFPA